MRKKIVAGNWKMNKTPKQAAELCALLKDKVNTDKVDVVFCVPAVDIATVVEAVKGTNIAVGAENMHFEESGIYRRNCASYAYRNGRKICCDWTF